MRELSNKEYKIQLALGTLSEYEVIVKTLENGNTSLLYSTSIRASNFVDALYKVWKKARK